MFKRTVSSVIVSGLLLGAAAAYAAQGPYPTAAREFGSSFRELPDVELSDLNIGYKERGSAYPAAAREFGSSIKKARDWPEVDLSTGYENSPFPPAAKEK